MTRQDWHPLAGLAILCFAGVIWMTLCGLVAGWLWP
jgi:hypothetical protein